MGALTADGVRYVLATIDKLSASKKKKWHNFQANSNKVKAWLKQALGVVSGKSPSSHFAAAKLIKTKASKLNNMVDENDLEDELPIVAKPARVTVKAKRSSRSRSPQVESKSEAAVPVPVAPAVVPEVNNGIAAMDTTDSAPEQPQQILHPASPVLQAVILHQRLQQQPQLQAELIHMQQGLMQAIEQPVRCPDSPVRAGAESLCSPVEAAPLDFALSAAASQTAVSSGFAAAGAGAGAYSHFDYNDGLPGLSGVDSAQLMRVSSVERQMWPGAGNEMFGYVIE